MGCAAVEAMEMEETDEIKFIDDFFVRSGNKKPSLMEVPFAIRKIPWVRSGVEKIYVHGKCNGTRESSFEIDMWNMEVPLQGKPKLLIRQVGGAWMELRKPRDFYLETMKTVMVASHFLIFAKQSPDSSQGDVWRYLRRECGEFTAKPNHKDLMQSFLLCRAIVPSDPRLLESPIILQFFPTLLRGLPVAQGSDDSRKRLDVEEDCSAVPETPTFEEQSSGKETTRVEMSIPVVDISKGGSSLRSSSMMHGPAECEAPPLVPDISRGETSLQSTPTTRRYIEFEASPPVADISKGGSSLQSLPKTHITAECEASPLVDGILRGETSLQSTPRTHSLSEFVIEADPPLSDRLTLESKKRKVGRPARPSARKNRKEIDKGSVVGNDDWIDEPDVCAFCDDGVEKGYKLLCCDGQCMRSFHPTVDSGRQNKCPTLCLTGAAESVENWICPNCEAGQHQCFACGKLGNSTLSTDYQEVFVCGAKQCKRFYHPVCVAKLLVPDVLVSKLLMTEQKDLAFRIQSKLETFICPLHKCASCNVDEDKKDPRLRLIKCRRCPTAWHEKCLPEVCRNQLWSLQDGKHVMYCGLHRLDPELQTPKRDHIKFPALKSVVSPDPGGEPHHPIAHHTVRDIISELQNCHY